MPNFIGVATEKAVAFWQKISITQRIFVAGLTVLVLAGFLGFMFWLNQPNYKILYSNLGPEDANRIVKMLQAEKVSYRLEDNGKTVLVPAPNLYELRIKVAGEAGLVGSGIGFEIFDDVKVGQTDFVQKINYQRALQGELARTINEFPNVDSARVHLVVPQRSLFIEEQQKPSASVVIRLKDPGKPMGAKEIQGIVNMIVMAVQGLEKDRVSVTDSSGKPLYFPDEDSLTGLSVTQREHKTRVERGLERRIDELLAPVLGPGKVIAKVNADLDFSQRTIHKEIFDSENPVVRSEQRSEETNQGRANLESGSTDVNFRGDGLNGALSSQEGTRETRTTNYEINKEEHNIVAQVGQVSRLSVAVAVDGIYDKNEEGAYVFKPRAKEELDRIRLLVSNAVGFERSRGDTVEVLCIPFGEADLPQDPNVAELVAQYAERLGKPLINALLAFLFLMLVVRPVILALIRPKVEAGEVIEGLEGLPSAEEQLALYEAQEEAAKAAVEDANRAAMLDTDLDAEEDEFDMLQRLEDIKAHASQLAEHNMEQTVIVLRGWMKNETKATVRA